MAMSDTHPHAEEALSPRPAPEPVPPASGSPDSGTYGPGRPDRRKARGALSHDGGGMRLVTLNRIMLLLSLLLFGVVIYATADIASEYRASIEATEKYISWEKAGQAIHRASDYLTEEARLFVQTRNISHADKYFRELYSTRSREKALERLAGQHTRSGDHPCIQTAIELSDALTHKEIYAIRLMADGLGIDLQKLPPPVGQTRLSAADRALSPVDKIERARTLMFDQEYIMAKRQIFSVISHFLDDVLELTRAEQQRQTGRLGDVLARQRIALGALCLSSVFIFTVIIFLVVRPLRSFDHSLRKGILLQPAGAKELRHLAGTYNEIFTLKEHQDQILRHKAEHDPLTDLLNRSALDGLKTVLDAAGSPVGLVLVDVDNFKHVNDTYGHETGDAALQRVADLLRACFRSEDFCIRLGGDEFAVLLQGAGPEMIPVIERKITAMNAALRKPTDSLPPLSVSVGVAFSPAGFPDTLYGNADSALYRVKEAGRCGCFFYSDEEDAPAGHDSPGGGTSDAPDSDAAKPGAGA